MDPLFFHTDMQAMTIERLLATIANCRRNPTPLTRLFIEWAEFYINQKTKGTPYNGN